MQGRNWGAVVLALALVVGGAACSDDEPKAKQQDGDTEGTTTPTTAAVSADLVEAACDRPHRLVAAEPRRITGSEVVEASGVAIVAGQTGPTWVHNDSGDRARVFAIDDAGAVTSHDVPGAEAVDWEDMAAGPDGLLYIGDIGDNGEARASITVYRFPPPDPATGAPATDVAALKLTYEDGPHNAEALMVDPVGEQLVIVTKGEGPAGVYTAPLAFENGAEATLGRVGELTTPLPGLFGQVTGGDISPDGSAILLRTYGSGLLFRRSAGEPIEEALARPACDVPTGPEAQGEAIAFSGTGDRFLTIGEGDDPTISGFAPG